MGEALLVHGGERLEDRAEQRARLVEVHGARAGEARGERLAVDVVVADVHPAVGERAGLDVARKAGVLHGPDEAVRRHEAVQRPRVARHLALDELEGGLAVAALLARGEVDDAGAALADLLLDGEGADLGAGRELVGVGQADGRDLANPRVDVRLVDQERVDERLDRVDLRAVIHEGAGERALRRGPADLLGVEPQRAAGDPLHVLEREQPLELAAHDREERVADGDGSGDEVGDGGAEGKQVRRWIPSISLGDDPGLPGERGCSHAGGATRR